jgi:hypothetical protein
MSFSIAFLGYTHVVEPGLTLQIEPRCASRGRVDFGVKNSARVNGWDSPIGFTLGDYGLKTDCTTTAWGGIDQDYGNASTRSAQ